MLRALGFALFISLAVSVGHSQDAAEFVMERPSSPDAETLVIGGRRVQDAKKWPATFKFGKGKSEFCTATAIGPRVILTAAHCLPNRARGHVIINDKKTAVICEHHPEYTPCPTATDTNCPANKSTSADYALCIAAADLDAKEYETLNANPSVPAVGGKVVLTGFGCNKDGGTDGGFGYLFEGETLVQTLPGGVSQDKWAIYYITTKGGAALCYGDSGGPSYKLLDAEGKSRVYIGVNSRSAMTANEESYISATSTKSFVDWAVGWAKIKSTADYSVQVCGIHPGVRGCHP